MSDLDGKPGHGEHHRHRDDHLRHLPPVLVGLAAGRAHRPLEYYFSLLFIWRLRIPIDVVISTNRPSPWACRSWQSTWPRWAAAAGSSWRWRSSAENKIKIFYTQQKNIVKLRQGSARDGSQGERPQSLKPCQDTKVGCHLPTTHRTFNFTQRISWSGSGEVGGG